jgi:hypothetical protein
LETVWSACGWVVLCRRRPAGSRSFQPEASIRALVKPRAGAIGLLPVM